MRINQLTSHALHVQSFKFRPFVDPEKSRVEKSQY